MALDPYEVTSSRSVLSTRFVDVREDLIRHGGENGVHYCVELPRAAVVVPVLPDGSIVMIRQWRHCVGKVLWEVPAGRAAPGEPIELAAARELEEETGYRTERLESLGHFFPLAGISDHIGYVFAATGLVAGLSRLEALEKLETVTIPSDRVIEMLTSGEIEDGFAQVALLRWFLASRRLLNSEKSKRT